VDSAPKRIGGKNSNNYLGKEFHMAAAVLSMVAAVTLAVTPVLLALAVAATTRASGGNAKPGTAEQLYRQKYK
jgi:hypothetical protein